MKIKYLTIDVDSILASKTIMNSSQVGNLVIKICQKAKFGLEYIPKQKEAGLYQLLNDSLLEALNRQSVAKSNASRRWNNKSRGDAENVEQ